MTQSQNEETQSVGSESAAVRLLRLPQVLQYFPISRSAWWAGIKDGRYPRPLKIGPRCVAWRFEDVVALVEACAAAGGTVGGSQNHSKNVGREEESL